MRIQHSVSNHSFNLTGHGSQTKGVKENKEMNHDFMGEILHQLKDHMYELATDILGKPNNPAANSEFLRFGIKNEISVGIRGPHQGVYTNFKTNVKGGPFKLIEDQKNLSFPKEVLSWAQEWLLRRFITSNHKPGNVFQTAKKSIWEPIVPIPDDVEDPDITGNKYLNYMLKDGKQLIAKYAYRDETGKLKGYAVRFEKEGQPRGGEEKIKFIIPLSYCQNENGYKAWKWQAFEKENRSLYGIEKLAANPNKPILIVEGEKAANAAQNLLPEYHVLTWGGGASNATRTDWSPLAGSFVTIWPDNDQPGQKAAKIIQNILDLLNAQQGTGGLTHIVKVPVNLPHQWDLGDPLPKGLTYEMIVNCLTSQRAPS